MKRLALSLLLIPTIVLAQPSHFIQIIPSPGMNLKSNSNGKLDVRAIVKQAYSSQLAATQQHYRNLRVKTIYNKRGAADHLIVIKNIKGRKGFTFDRINLDKNHTLISHYTPVLNDNPDEPAVTTPHCPDNNTNFVVSSYDYSDPYRAITTSPAVNEIVASAKKAGYNVTTLFDKKATAQNILNYLSCPNVKLYQDTGDGVPTAVETADGWLDSNTIDKLLKNKLQDKVIYFNDCSVARKDEPQSIEKIIMKNGAQAFIGGITDLETITTDQASACFWHQALQGKSMKEASPFCQNQYDYGPNQGDDGITGYFSNGNDKISGIKQPLSQQDWGALAGGTPTASTTPLGKALSNRNGDDKSAAASAATQAQNDCKQQGGINCTQRSNHIQFQNCSSIVPSDTKVYFGFGTSVDIAQKQAMTECKQDENDPKSCATTALWSGCNKS